MRLRFWKREHSDSLPLSGSDRRARMKQAIAEMSDADIAALDERLAEPYARMVSDTWAMKFSAEALEDFDALMQRNTLTNSLGDRLTFELQRFPETREALFFVTQHYHGGCSCTHEDCPSPAAPLSEVTA